MFSGPFLRNNFIKHKKSLLRPLQPTTILSTSTQLHKPSPPKSPHHTSLRPFITSTTATATTTFLSPYLPSSSSSNPDPTHHPYSPFSTHSRPMSTTTTTTPTDTYSGIWSNQIGIQMDTIRCFDDNNCYVLRDPDGYITLVDPAEPSVVIPHLLNVLNIDLKDQAVAQKTQILTTHHHWDHAGGNEQMATEFPHLAQIVGGSKDQIPNVTKSVEDGEEFVFGRYHFTAHHTPCHTKGHICFAFRLNNDDEGKEQQPQPIGIFTGDTLFSSGCGKFFEGTASQMYQNMSSFLLLPDSTFVFDGHEYTLSNLKYTVRCEPENREIQRKLKWVLDHPGVMTHPTTIGIEKQVNTFLRAGSIEVLDRLRTAKNQGKAVILEAEDIRQGLI